VERWIAEYLHYLEEGRRYSKATLRAYAEEMRRFEEFGRSRVKRALRVPADLTPELISAFAAARSLERTDAKRPIAARTLARSLAAVRSFLRYAERRGHSTATARAAVPRVSVPDTLPSSVAETALNALLDDLSASVRPDDARMLRALAAVECLYGAGLRVGELAGSTRGRLDERRLLLRVLGKGSRERVVPLSRRAMTALTRYWAALDRPPGSEEALLPGPRGAGVTARTLERDVNGSTGAAAPLPVKVDAHTDVDWVAPIGIPNADRTASPAKPCVSRTCRKAAVTPRSCATSGVPDCASVLSIAIDGQTAVRETFRTQPGWNEHAVRITGNLVRGPRPRLEVSGRYASFQYWFFQ
jgi:integrase/recombinase XerC